MAETDRAALVALYNATGGAKWYNNRNWCTNATLSQWYGVDVDTQGRVVKLALNSNNLQGAIPKELGDLSELQMLNLWTNKLRG
ncbi:unnamed protein product, partial [Pylaiella littoralis]